MLRFAARNCARPAFVRLLSSSAEGRPVTWQRAGGDSVPGFAFGDPKNPGVIVLQEWWGITSQVKSQAAYVASQGYSAIVPDLYRGKVSLEVAEAQHLMTGLDWMGALEDIKGAASFLRKSGSEKVGVMGFCMGGALSLHSATLSPSAVDAAVCFYGVSPPALEAASNCQVPVQCHFGKNDPLAGFSDLTTALALADKLRQCRIKGGPAHEVHLYEDCGHAFLNDEEKMQKVRKNMGFGDHNEDAVQTAWRRVFAFWKTHLH